MRREAYLLVDVGSLEKDATVRQAIQRGCDYFGIVAAYVVISHIVAWCRKSGMSEAEGGEEQRQRETVVQPVTLAADLCVCVRERERSNVRSWL